MKAIIFSTTGMIGKSVLNECLVKAEVKSILAINRKTSEVQQEKFSEIIHENFFDLSAIQQRLSGYDVCFFCAGISSVACSEKEYNHITYEMTLSVAKEILKLNPSIIFCYISGAGADSSENGKIMWARIKGKTENALLKMPFNKVYCFRPGYIQPLGGIKSKTGLYNIFYAVLKPFYFLFKGFKSYVTDSKRVGKAFVKAALIRYEKNILENSDINKIGS